MVVGLGLDSSSSNLVVQHQPNHHPMTSSYCIILVFFFSLFLCTSSIRYGQCMNRPPSKSIEFFFFSKDIFDGYFETPLVCWIVLEGGKWGSKRNVRRKGWDFVES